MIAGVDLNSFAIDFVLLDEDTNEAVHHRRRLDTGPGDSFQRARRVRDALPTRASWKDSGITLLAVEKPMGDQNRGLVPLMRVQGALLSCLPAELTVIELEPYRWRQGCGLKGNASKQQIAAWVVATFPGAAGWGQDACDAYAIAYAARKLVHRQTTQVA